MLKLQEKKKKQFQIQEDGKTVCNLEVPTISSKYGTGNEGHMVLGKITGKALVLSNTITKTGVCTVSTIDFTWPDGGNISHTQILPRNFIAIDGISLTVCKSTPGKTFSVQLGCKTMETVTLAQFKKKGDYVNVEAGGLGKSSLSSAINLF